ncbi:MAG TPA: hypothetical protein VM942_08110, partial [Acidimicrobiales bacterium]|nr:hypothetical protein [Acidimicrobiales bacterium]
GLTVLLRRGWAQAAKTVVVPAAVYLLWLMVAGRDSLGAQSNDLAGLLQFGDFVWAGLSNAFERSVGLAGGGPVLLLALAVWLLRRSTLAPTAAAPAFAGALGAVVLFAIIAVGRSGLGAAQPDGPRYVYICIALVLPAVGLALSDLASGGPGRTIAVLGFLGLVLVHNLALLREDAGRDAERERIMKGRVLAGGEVVGSAAATDDGLRALTGLPDLTVGALRRMADEAKLPPPTGVTGEDRLAAATFLQLGVGPGTMDPALPPTARLGEVRRAAVGAAGDGSTSSCVRVTPEAGGVPEVVLTPADDLTAGPISVSLASPGGGELKLSLRTAAGEAVTGPSRTVALAPGQVVRVDDAAPNTSLVLDLPAGGTVDLCGVATGAP